MAEIRTIMPAAPKPAAPASSARAANRLRPILETAASVRAGGADEAARRNSIFTPSAPGTRRNSLTIIPSHTSSKPNLKAESSTTASLQATGLTTSRPPDLGDLHLDHARHLGISCDEREWLEGDATGYWARTRSERSTTTSGN
ncbi:unnamed protein product [Tilletia controversa]|nr:unnamed protein product [Tilletia controversa]